MRSKAQTLSISAVALISSFAAAGARAEAGPVTPQFTQAMAEVDEAWRSAGGFRAATDPPSSKRNVPGPARFAEAYRKLVPLVPTGLALDDVVERYKFALAAASVSCTAGMPKEMKQYAELGELTFPSIPENRRYPGDLDGPQANFELGDMAQNEPPGGLYGANNSAAAYGWDIRNNDCGGIRFRGTTNFTQATATTTGIKLHCMWARPCSGRLTIRVQRQPKTGPLITGPVLLTRRFSLPADTTRALPLQLTAAGRRVFSKPARTKAVLTMKSRSPGNSFPGDSRIQRVVLRGASR